VNLTASMEAPCPPEELFGWVDDLARYPAWLGIVERAVPLPAVGGSPDDPPAWSVDLRGRLGPFARSKRLRMVRTELVTPTIAVFERRETDERHHSHWMLRAEVTPRPTGSALQMRLHYGGALWGPVLERLLADEVDRGRRRLLDLVSTV
jgi:hypothetical protein